MNPVEQSSPAGHPVVLVSGVARAPGIGYATALQLADTGADLVCADLVGSGDTGYASSETFEAVLAEITDRAAGARRPGRSPTRWRRSANQPCRN